ncbi:Glycosyl transferase family 2 protein [Candidatus Protochlamydia naegleriophila]|uniref:Glycosyl transferase family 2 protein n=1 Tax=Candidatus Protochlamydia naegleriophila TaxID=389348 RepID=A0A0U5ERN5_9BACT|nr:glycosyltransferase family 2 protein [Candidatus Protochlamydia naegleriophila]CUI16819.1 Glycosyl transferase family 2 protein [Candidatus Protochlamydia naegleriophila]
MSIDILLATYQGAAFLEEQLSSIFEQTHSDFHLWIRDDCSSDQTRPLIEHWANLYPEKITVLPSDKNVGIAQNFSELLKASKASYICFADQDDKWLSSKLERSLAQMQALEKQYGSAVPLLVHTDLAVAEKDLTVIAHSFWRYMGLNPRLTGLNRLLMQNNVTGCTMMMNRPLADLAQPIPPQIVMHDWWIALVAACFGYIGIVEDPTLLYRQHGSNDTGAKKYSFRKYWSQSNKDRQKKIACCHCTHRQAQQLLERYHSLLSPSRVEVLKAYAVLREQSYFKQKKLVIKHGFFKQGLMRSLKALVKKA